MIQHRVHFCSIPAGSAAFNMSRSTQAYLQYARNHFQNKAWDDKLAVLLNSHLCLDGPGTLGTPVEVLLLDN